VTTKNVPKYFQMSTEGQNHPFEDTGLRNKKHTESTLGMPGIAWTLCLFRVAAEECKGGLPEAL
jgi:hypothetical protein